ncbi:MAG: transglutaminase family protein, partial [Deltaproteobacteria bacterium]|nr:transglutaminase family protein [Deltaproteobacteria bacterium]
RYVSGYLHRRGAPEVETHAWCEAFFPSAGWVGLDPTHGALVGESHVAVAAGRSYADVPPNRGVYRGESEETIAATVTIEELAAVPDEIGFHAAPASVVAGAAAATPMPSLSLEQQFQQDRARAQVQQQRQQQQ